jgi:hypothetical protein
MTRLYTCTFYIYIYNTNCYGTLIYSPLGWEINMRTIDVQNGSFRFLSRMIGTQRRKKGGGRVNARLTLGKVVRVRCSSSCIYPNINLSVSFKLVYIFLF